MRNAPDRALVGLVAALVLAVVLAVPVQAQDQPPRDEVVPEGLEGLSLDEVLARLQAATAAGDVARARELLEHSARIGNTLAAVLLAAEAFQKRLPDWRARVRYFAGLDLEADHRTATGYFWLGLAEDRELDRFRSTAPLGQADLFYRLHAYSTVAANAERSDLQRHLDAMQVGWLGGSPLPPRYLSAIQWGLALRARSKAEVYSVYVMECSGPSAWTRGNAAADAYCWLLLRRAAARGQPSAMFQAALQTIRETLPRGARVDERQLQWWLCWCAESGNPEAAAILAERLTDAEREAYVHLTKLAYLVEAAPLEKHRAQELLTSLFARMSALEVQLFDERFGGLGSANEIPCVEPALVSIFSHIE